MKLKIGNWVSFQYQGHLSTDTHTCEQADSENLQTIPPEGPIHASKTQIHHLGHTHSQLSQYVLCYPPHGTQLKPS